jgi:hypothetical protein
MFCVYVRIYLKLIEYSSSKDSFDTVVVSIKSNTLNLYYKELILK